MAPCLSDNSMLFVAKENPQLVMALLLHIVSLVCSVLKDWFLPSAVHVHILQILHCHCLKVMVSSHPLARIYNKRATQEMPLLLVIVSQMCGKLLSYRLNSHIIGPVQCYVVV
jgi:hypothetical protein